jgi:Leucine-rich repeat (LRR) protein
MNLDTLPPEIAFCERLETLDMIGNPIDNLPDTLVECRQLHDLKINYKTFYKVLDTYMLKLIDEGKIRSEHIPQVIFELENLQILDLSRTKINAISNQQALNNLTELYLLHNSFFDIPESVCRMTQLKLLDMSHNRLQTIPEYIDKMKRVETLILSYNHLSSVSRFFARLVTLRRLILSHNHLDVIDEELSQSQSLRTLDLSSNSLAAIPEELCDLQQLETLDLRSNLIECLPLAMRRMTGLKSMNRFDDDFQRTGLHLLGNAIFADSESLDEADG